MRHANHLDRELELVVHFRHQQIMAQSLPHLHDPHDGGIDLILTILKDPFCGTGLLLHLGEKDLLKQFTNNLKALKRGNYCEVTFVPFLSSGSGLS